MHILSSLLAKTSVIKMFGHNFINMNIVILEGPVEEKHCVSGYLLKIKDLN